MKEDLNLIFTIDISQQSTSYYRKHYTVIIQEALRAFEFKWDPNNIDNKQLRSRMQVYGISKPRKTIKITKIFDTLKFNFGVNDQEKTGIEDMLEIIKLAIENPEITQSKGMTPPFEDTINELKLFYEEERRKNDNTKLVHLQDTIPDSGLMRSIGTHEVKFQILIATTDVNFKKMAETHFFEMGFKSFYLFNTLFMLKTSQKTQLPLKKPRLRLIQQKCCFLSI